MASLRDGINQALAHIPSDKKSSFRQTLDEVEFELQDGEKVGAVVARRSGVFTTSWEIAIITNRRLIRYTDYKGMQVYTPDEYEMSGVALVNKENSYEREDWGIGIESDFDTSQMFKNFLYKVFD